MKVPFRPGGDQMLVKADPPITEEKTPGGIIKILKPEDTIQPTRGIIVAVGSKVEEYAVGQKITYSQHAGKPLDIYGETYLIMRELGVEGELFPQEK